MADFPECPYRVDTEEIERALRWKRPKPEHLVPTEWGWVVAYPENFMLGNHVDIGYGTYIQARYGVVIDDNVQIGSHCAIYSHNTINGTKGKVLIKKETKIGAFSLILPGTTLDGYYKAYSIIRD